MSWMKRARWLRRLARMMESEAERSGSQPVETKDSYYDHLTIAASMMRDRADELEAPTKP